VTRRRLAETVFANLLALFMIALVTAGCGVQQSLSDRPNWSLNGPDRPSSSTNTSTTPAKRYGDWNGPGAPKPLTVDGW
jgi:hypothetical protein